jgi:hypothetical protein
MPSLVLALAGRQQQAAGTIIRTHGPLLSGGKERGDYHRAAVLYVSMKYYLCLY